MVGSALRELPKPDKTYENLDCDCIVGVRITPIDIQGKKGIPSTVKLENPVTLPSLMVNVPSIRSIHVVCPCWKVGKLAVLEVEYADIQGDGRIQWIRKLPGDITHIVQKDTFVYKLCREDVGAIIYAIYSPIKGSGTSEDIVVFDENTHQIIRAADEGDDPNALEEEIEEIELTNNFGEDEDEEKKEEKDDIMDKSPNNNGVTEEVKTFVNDIIENDNEIKEDIRSFVNDILDKSI